MSSLLSDERRDTDQEFLSLGSRRQDGCLVGRLDPINPHPARPCLELGYPLIDLEQDKRDGEISIGLRKGDGIRRGYRLMADCSSEPTSMAAAAAVEQVADTCAAVPPIIT